MAYCKYAFLSLAVLAPVSLLAQSVDVYLTAKDHGSRLSLSAKMQLTDARPLDEIERQGVAQVVLADEEPHGKHLLALAVYFGPTRLIDNTVLSFPE